MVKVMFVCHGNICRSPIAEFVFKHITKQDADKIKIESRAVSTEEIGNDIYSPAKAVLKKNNIPFEKHRATQITMAEYDEFDYIIIMEQYNMPRLKRIIGDDYSNKVFRLLDFTEKTGDIEDPWYSGNFDKVFEQIYYACECLKKHLKEKGEV